MRLFYKLDDENRAIPVDGDVWEATLDDSRHRQIALDEVGDAWVSTVFLGMDYRANREGPPLLFETMIFGSEIEYGRRRYVTYDEALEGHGQALDQILAREARLSCGDKLRAWFRRGFRKSPNTAAPTAIESATPGSGVE